MATFRISLDTRSKQASGKYPVKIFIQSSTTKVTKALGISVLEKFWIGGEDGQFVSKSCPNAKLINESLQAIDYKFRSAFIELQRNADMESMTAVEIKDRIFNTSPQKRHSLIEDMADYAEKSRSSNTKQTYKYTISLLSQYTKSQPLQYSKISYDWLKTFDRWLEDRGLKINSRGIVMRNIRIIYNDAINKGKIGYESYPFRTFKIKTAKKDKDFLRPEDIIILRNMKLSGRLEYTRDVFLLSFYFGGINPIDLFNLKPADAKGRISYERQKIRDRTESNVVLKIQPEAEHIIEKYRGEKYLLNFAEKYSCFRTFYSHVRMNIPKIGEELGYPKMTLYWARYTWSTLAGDIGIDGRIISKVLGHTEGSLAERKYIIFNWDRADEANRKLLDFIFNKKEPLII
jgi:site-specific recombinase XerD|nr:MAG TPA: Integrase [Caudoviricetes sp.]